MVTYGFQPSQAEVRLAWAPELLPKQSYGTEPLTCGVCASSR